MPKRKSAASRNGRGIEAFFENQRKRQHVLEQEAYGSSLNPFHPDLSATKMSTSANATTISNDNVVISSASAASVKNTEDQTKSSLEVANSGTEVDDKIIPTAQPPPTTGKLSISSSKTIEEQSTILQTTPQSLTTDPLIFDPSTYPVSSWPKINAAIRKKTSNDESTSAKISAPYSFLSQAFTIIADTSSRITTINILSNMLRVLIIHAPSDILPTLWLCSNTIGASYKGIELGIGPLVLTKALTAVSGATRQKLHQLYKDHGDWGDVAYAVKTSVRTIVEPRPLTIAGVFNTLHTVASVEGKGTVNEKCKHIQRLLLAAKDNEARYIVRTCVGNLRIGAVGTTVLIGFARACVLSLTPPLASSPPSPSHQKDTMEVLFRNPDDSTEELIQKMKIAEGFLKECYAQCPNWDVIVPWLLKCGDIRRIFEQCGLTVGIYHSMFIYFSY